MLRTRALIGLLASATACTPVAVGCVVGGGATLVGAKVMHRDRCASEGCLYNNALATTLAVIGAGLLLGGGLALAVDQER